MILNSFSAGEVSPNLEGRVDSSKYYEGSRTLENMIVTPHGPAIKRSGTYYIADANDTVNTRIIPFEVSTGTAYVLEFGDTYMRVFKE